MFLIAKLVTDGYRAQTIRNKKRLQTQKNGRNWNLENVGFGVHKYMLLDKKNWLYQGRDQIILNWQELKINEMKLKKNLLKILPSSLGLRNFITLHSFCYISVFEKCRSHFTEKMTFCVHDDQSFGKSCAARAAQSNTSTWWSSKKLPYKIASNKITMGPKI